MINRHRYVARLDQQATNLLGNVCGLQAELIRDYQGATPDAYDREAIKIMQELVDAIARAHSHARALAATTERAERAEEKRDTKLRGF